MNVTRLPGRSTAIAAMVCGGLIGFQYLASVVTRDVLFLSSLDVAARPLMVGVSGASWVLLAVVNFRFRQAPLATVVPVTFGVSAALILLDWSLTASLPALAARMFFLQTTALGPVLGSHFWLVVSTQWDPRSARIYFGRIMGAGTLGGLVGALVAGQLPKWFGIGSMLPLLAAANLIAGGLLWRLASRQRHDGAALPVETLRDTVRQVARLDYVPILAAVLLLGAFSAAFAEHLMNQQAQVALDPSNLPRFFSTYYMGVAIVVLVAQTTLAERAINTLGIGMSMSIPSLVLGIGSVGAWFLPGLLAVTAAYGSSSVVYDSLFKKGYELFFTSVSPSEKRTFKLIVDGLFSRMGATAGAAVIALLTLLSPAWIYPGLLLATLLCCSGVVLLANRMGRLYIHSLERSLLSRADDLDPDDPTTRTVVMRSLSSQAQVLPSYASNDTTTPDPASRDPVLSAIAALRSRNRDAVRGVLQTEEGPPAMLVAHIIPLLEWDPVAEDAVRALRKVAEERVGELVDTLVDPSKPFAVRRRLARVFSVCVSQRSVDGVVLGLEDLRFEVRFQCGRSLAAILEKNPRLRVDRERLFDTVRREVAVGRPVWENHRLLDTIEADSRSFVDEFLKDRAGQSLAHVFTLLSLVLPSAPLHLVYRALHTSDGHLRATALEYLDCMLPPDVFDGLLPVVDEPRSPLPRTRSREAVLANLLRSDEAIMLNLEELRRRASEDAAPLEKGIDSTEKA